MILVAGSANLDFVVRAPRIPSPGETVMGQDFQTFAGGKGANQAVACARSGDCATQLLAAFGDDVFAATIESSLRAAKVQVHALRTPSTSTGAAFICVAANGENAITVAPGANLLLRLEHLPSLQGISHLLLQLETPIATVTAFAQAAKAQGVCVVLNAAPAMPLPPELTAALDVLVVNEGELRAITRCTESLDECMARLAVDTVVVTLGARGCCARQAGQYFLQPAFAVEAVDTTAAGDTFCGALVAALSKGWALPDALTQACAAGALACTRAGAQASIPPAAEVTEFLRRQAPATVRIP